MRDMLCGRDVSTVRLPFDHSGGEGPPELWETMIFDEFGQEVYKRRYPDEESARRGHRETVEAIRNGGRRRR